MEEKLIELVRNYPELYDLSHKKYMDIGFKNNIWNNIGKELKLEGSACKARWNNIRDNYRKYLKKNITKSGQSSKKIKLYKYAEELGFLKKFFDERDTKGNIEFQKDETEEQEDHEEQADEEENTVHDVDTPTVAKETDGESNQSSVHQRLEKRIQQTPKIAKKRTAPQESASSQLMQYLIKKQSEQPATSTLTLTHPVDAFLASIGASLKTFKPYDLISAKKEIFDVVHKYEMKMIIEQTSGKYSLSSDLQEQSGSSGTCVSRQYSNLTSPRDMARTSFSNTSTEIHYTDLTSADDMTQVPFSPDPVVDVQQPRVHDNSVSETLSHEKQNTLQSFFQNYQN